jgi:IS1 family transposase
MHIHTPAEKLTAVKSGDRIQVHSFGHVYSAQVSEVKGNRLLATWINKSGVEYERWLTIPGKTLKERNPITAETRKRRAEATNLEKYALGSMAESRCRNRTRALELRALLRDLPNQTVTVEQAGWMSDDWAYYQVGSSENQFAFRKSEGTTVEQAVKSHYRNALQNLRQVKLHIRRNLARVEELRIEANLIEKGAAK